MEEHCTACTVSDFVHWPLSLCAWEIPCRARKDLFWKCWVGDTATGAIVTAANKLPTSKTSKLCGRSGRQKGWQRGFLHTCGSLYGCFVCHSESVGFSFNPNPVEKTEKKAAVAIRITLHQHLQTITKKQLLDASVLKKNDIKTLKKIKKIYMFVTKPNMMLRHMGSQLVGCLKGNGQRSERAFVRGVCVCELCA